MKEKKKRCKWCISEDKLYIEYHDKEWGKLNKDEKYLYEMLILESFQAGLSWKCVLDKRESFKKAYRDFDIDKVSEFNENDIRILLENKGIIRNKLKIKASINNSIIFKEIVLEYGTFFDYIKKFVDKLNLSIPIYEEGKVSSELSDSISKDLKSRGMKFVGTVIIYSYLQAIGVIYSHEKGCYLGKDK